MFSITNMNNLYVIHVILQFWALLIERKSKTNLDLFDLHSVFLQT